MRVKILKHCRTPAGPFNEGQIVDVPPEMARKFLEMGLAGPVKSETETAMLDVPAETAVIGSVTDKREVIKEQTRKRVQRFREKKKALQDGDT